MPEAVLFLTASEVYGHIPKKHFYEQLGELLDLEFVYELTRPLYAEKMGRPGLDPVVFFKCMLVGFFENIVYDTHLEFRLADSLTFRKFLGCSLEERTPDESTLGKTRQKMPVEVFDQVFSYVLDVCQSNSLLRGRAIGTDSTQIDANASMDSLVHKELGCTYEEYVLALRRQDVPDATKGDAMSADKGHHSGENLAGLEEREIIGLVSSPNTNKGAKGFRRDDFVYDEHSDALVCPAGQGLSRQKKRDQSHRYYKGRGSVCKRCPHFNVCTKSKSGRVVSVSI